MSVVVRTLAQALGIDSLYSEADRARPCHKNRMNKLVHPNRDKPKRTKRKGETK